MREARTQLRTPPGAAPLGGPVTGRAIAAREALPADYVVQIMLCLRRVDIVASTSGAQGRYALARPPRELSVKDVLHASELSTFDLHRVSHSVNQERCAESGDCGTHPVGMLLQQRIDELLCGVCSSDVMANAEAVRDRVGLVTLTKRLAGLSPAIPALPA
jgi:Rrf2 family iron-sulfur cluster assembly transcriptional regulator